MLPGSLLVPPSLTLAGPYSACLFLLPAGCLQGRTRRRASASFTKLRSLSAYEEERVKTLVMDGIDMEEDNFYYCTEVTPRCFVIQRAITFDRGQIERMVGDLEKTQPAEAPPPPQMPYWFNSECRSQLVSNSFQASPVANAPSPVPILSPSELKQQLKAQLEYYFSRENLITDKYLRCQMDADQYVPIAIIAGFRKVAQLTNDFNLVLEALRESNQVEVDEKGEKVRPASKRCTIILREISEEHKQDVVKMLSGGPPYLELKYGLNNSWYVIYDNEEDTQKAYLHIQNLDNPFNNKPVCARIKAGGPPTQELPIIERPLTTTPDPLQQEIAAFTPLVELGQLLASYGYVSAGIFTPDGSGGVQDEEPVIQSVYNRIPSRNIHSPREHNGYGGTNGYSHNHGERYHNGYNDRKSPREGQRRNTGPSFSGNNGMRRGGHRDSDRGERNSYSELDTSHESVQNKGIQIVKTSQYNPLRPALTPVLTSAEYLTSEIPVNPAEGPRRNTIDSRPRRPHDFYPHNQNNYRDLPSPNLSASANEINHHPPERPRYHSFRRDQKEEGASNDFLTVPHRRKPWERAETPEEEPKADQKNSGNRSTESAYSFEDSCFPKLSDPKPVPAKPVEKPSFSCVAAGKRYAKPEPKKSYADKLKQSRP